MHLYHFNQKAKKLKDQLIKTKLETLVIKTFKANKLALEKEINKHEKGKKKTNEKIVQTLSLYDDKSLKNFEQILKKVLK